MNENSKHIYEELEKTVNEASTVATQAARDVMKGKLRGEVLHIRMYTAINLQLLAANAILLN